MRRSFGWAVAGLAVAFVEWRYGMALDLANALLAIGGSDAGGYVRMSQAPSWWAALTFAGTRAMGFPFFLFVVRQLAGPSMTAACVALALVHVASSAVFYVALSRRHSLHPVALFMLLAAPGLVIYTTAPLTDTFAADLLMLGLATPAPALAAVALGALPLVRPPLLILAAVLVVVMALRQRTIAGVLVFTAVVGWATVTCWWRYATPCLLDPWAAACAVGDGLGTGGRNARETLSTHVPGDWVLVTDPWLAAHTDGMPLWLAPRAVWFAGHPVVAVVNLMKKTTALLDVRTRGVDERPGTAADATPRWWRWWARAWGAVGAAGVALAYVWVFDPRWRLVALAPLLHFAFQSPFHSTARYGLAVLPCLLVLVVWTGQRRPALLALGALAAAGFLWQTHVWDQLDPSLGLIEGWR